MFKKNMPSQKKLSGALLMCALFATTLPAIGYAAAPMVKVSAPGYFRMMLGDFEITALSDGTVSLPVNQLLKNTSPAKVDQALAQVGLHSPLETSVNAFLINTGDKLILIDTGAAKLFGPTLGKLLANLKAAGYQPDQIGDIYITHMHPDHVGGLTIDGQAAFPNAIVHADKKEADYWLSKQNMDSAPEAKKAYFEGAMTSLDPYLKNGKFKPVDAADAKMAPGLTVIRSAGHTPGHLSYAVESKGQKLIVWGDLIHVAAVQFDHPEVTIEFDSDAKAATKERVNAFAEAAKSGYLIAGSHLSFPGIGHIKNSGRSYLYTPVNYQVLP